jgi:cell division protein ZapE
VLLRDLAVPTDVLGDFVPPPRFGTTHFSSYKPQHPSQAVALETTRGFVKAIPLSKPSTFSWQRVFLGQKEPKGKGLYLDGGFGVGKTHLLASAYDAFRGTKLYLSFSELVYAMGITSFTV